MSLRRRTYCSLRTRLYSLTLGREKSRNILCFSESRLNKDMDNIQLAVYRATGDTISIALHTALSHRDKRNTYVRMLFIDYSSTFNTIEPSTLITKLRTLGLNTSLCN